MKITFKVINLLLAGLVSVPVFALPSLQLGPDGSPEWFYDNTSETWTLTGLSGGVYAYANAWGSADYAWSTEGESRIAYLSIAAAPKTETVPAFDVSVFNDSIELSIFESGYGAPPLADEDDLKNHDLSPHGVFDTYYEVYQFEFNGSAGLIGNTQPGDTGTGTGFSELFNITINSLTLGTEGIHIDLYTIDDQNQVFAFAPFSHDAAFVPEPGGLALMGLGLLVISFLGSRGLVRNT